MNERDEKVSTLTKRQMLLSRIDRQLSASFDGRLGEQAVWEAFHSIANYGYDWLEGEYGEGWELSVSKRDQVAQTLSSSGASGWWNSPIDRGHQTMIWWSSQGRDLLDRDRSELLRRDPADRTTEWVRAAQGKERDSCWASAPSYFDLAVTTRWTPFIPALALATFEDDFSAQSVTINTLDAIPAEVPVYEIGSPEDWVRLVESAPLEVADSRGPDWGRLFPLSHLSAPPRGGYRWYVPDWSEISHRYAGVHLTIDGYLDTAGYPIETRDGLTMLAGWAADETIWLQPLRAAHLAAAEYQRDGEITWHGPFNPR